MTDQAEMNQDILDEGMQPELSEDYFTLEGKRVQIKPLKLKYQKQFAKAFAPILDGIALAMAEKEREVIGLEDGKTVFAKKGITEFSWGDWLSIGSEMLNQVEFLPKVVQILCHNDGYMITDEELDETTIQEKDMQEIIIKYCRKRGEVEQKIVDFFTSVLPLVINEAVSKMDDLKAVIETAIKLKEADTMNTASSNPSAETTNTN